MAVWHQRSRSDRSRRIGARRGGLLAVLALIVISGGAFIAAAAVPAAPDNILVFPNRDFVTVEGFADHVGETATLRVTRGTNVVGSAQAVVSGASVAFEVNHPGGVCWGNGTALKVTPDILPGDKATISFGGTDAGDATVQDAFVRTLTYDAAVDPNKVVVTGRLKLDPGVDPGNVEQRIVNPDLTDLIGKRDVRAIPGPDTPAATGGYSSGMTTDAATNSFTATYIFNDPAVAQVVASGGGERLLTWQETDAAGNRQGVTIAELGEPGGPGMGGCPASPGDQAAPSPGTASVIRSADKTSMQVDWTPATAQPGATPVSGYSIEAIANTAAPSGHNVQIGRRTPAAATKATITGLDTGESYTVEVRSLAGPRMSEAFTVAPAPRTPGDTTPPTLSATPPPNGTTAVTATSVTLTSSGQVFYTTNGSPAILGDMPSDGAKLYTAPIAITDHTVLKVAAFDQVGNHTQLDGIYEPPAGPTAPPDAPTGLTGTAGQQEVALKWDAGDASITGYRVQTYDANGPVGAATPAAGKSVTITGLTAGTEHFFTVAAKNANGFGTESAKAGPYKPTGDKVTIATARWKAGDFRVTGSGTVAGATVSLRVGSPTAPVIGTALVVAAPPAAGGTFDLRLRGAAAQSTRPSTVYVTSDKGGVDGPFTVG
ncbi:MAG TPA: fibronectin type III domain-containing protein [Solirubrobacteraceae bacterium]